MVLIWKIKLRNCKFCTDSNSFVWNLCEVKLPSNWQKISTWVKTCHKLNLLYKLSLFTWPLRNQSYENRGGGGRGCTHIQTYGDDPVKRVSFFLKKSPHMCLIFHEKIPSYGCFFQNWLGFTQQTSEKSWKKWSVLVTKLKKKMVSIFIKIRRYGYLFFGKITSRYGYGFWTGGGTSMTNPNPSTPSLVWKLICCAWPLWIPERWAKQRPTKKILWISREDMGNSTWIPHTPVEDVRNIQGVWISGRWLIWQF